MGVAFWIFGYVAGFVTLLLLALSISSGLYLLAELAEEFPTMSGKITKYLLVVVLVLHVILLIDGLPLFETTVSIVGHLIYASTLRNFPFIDLISLSSIGSALAFICCNGMWLLHFTREVTEPFEVIGFFVICVWSMPCALFVSLTLGDNMLPVLSGPGVMKQYNESSDMSGLAGAGKKKNIFRMLFDAVTSLVERFPNSGIVQALKALSNKRK